MSNESSEAPADQQQLALLEMACESAKECISACSQLVDAAGLPDDQSAAKKMLVEWLIEASDKAYGLLFERNKGGRKIPTKLHSLLTSVADTSENVGPVTGMNNWHNTAREYAARARVSLMCPAGRPTQVVGKDGKGKTFVSEDGLKEAWPEVRLALRDLAGLDALRIVELIEQESERARGSARTSPHQQEENGGGVEPGAEPNRFNKAYESFLLAEKSKGCGLTDREAYEWLKEDGPTQYELPAFQTWNRYVREGRKLRGTQKNTPRGGRNGRSIVSPDDQQTRRKNG
jgi:hypothetical protein